jgi:hypothetical protein
LGRSFTYSAASVEPPTSDDYYTGDTSTLEFQLDDLLGHTTNEIGGTQLTGAPPVTQPT